VSWCWAKHPFGHNTHIDDGNDGDLSSNTSAIKTFGGGKKKQRQL
jgi:hypothetical protein